MLGYNQTFHVNFDTSADKFQNYYKDLSQHVKAREVDLLIVVNMFLTGFDATTLNTLWVDKNLKMHGLIQAFSRTNRILNSVKTYGNILRLKNILSAFDQFAGHELLPERNFQDYQSVYLDLYQAYRPKTDGDKENINDDITFEIELIRQVEINIDYILMLVMKYHESNCKDKSILGTIDRAIDSSIQRLAQFFEKYFGI